MGSILTGSFSNPEAAKDMLKAETPDHFSDEEDFERSLEMVKADREKTSKPTTNRRRRQAFIT